MFIMVASPAQSDSISDPSSSSASNSIMLNAYQEEICEKLIQLSFVKIVSSKSERGGARLRKNLLILHLLQKARMEQRNRLFASRNLHISGQNQEVPDYSLVQTSNLVRKDDEIDDSGNSGRKLDVPMGCGVEKIDVDESLSQHEADPRPPTPAIREDACDVSNVIINAGETSLCERTLDEGANAYSSRLLPPCEASQPAVDPISGNGKDQWVSDDSGRRAMGDNNTSMMDVDAGSSQEERRLSVSSGNCVNTVADDSSEQMSKRACLKRKHDSLENVHLADYNSPPKTPCIAHHHSPEQTGPAPTQQQPSSSINHLLSVLKTASLNTPSEGNVDNREDASAVSPLSRSLSCSSLMELTCES